MLCYSAGRNIPEGLFSDIYKGKIWQTFSIDPANPSCFFAQHTLNSHISLAINLDWFQPFQYMTHSTGQYMVYYATYHEKYDSNKKIY